MENGKPTAQNFADAIKRHYPASITDAEANEAASNLLGFMELLIEIDMEHGITRTSNSEVQP